MTATLQIALLIGINILPVVIWVYYLLRGDTKPEPQRLLILAFLLGGLATLPIFFLKYLLSALPWTTMSTLFQVDATAITAFTILGLLLSASFEEISKYSFVIKAMDIQFEGRNELSDGVLYGVIVALGFAFVENIYYLRSAFEIYGYGVEFLTIYILRGAGTMVAHAVFSGFFGLFYSLALIYPSKQIEREHKNFQFHHFMHNFSIQRFLFKGFRILLSDSSKEKVCASALAIEGVILAVLLHIVFNVLMVVPVFGHYLSYLVIPYLAITTIILFYILRVFTKRKSVSHP